VIQPSIGSGEKGETGKSYLKNGSRQCEKNGSSQCENLALTVLYVPSSLDSGREKDLQVCFNAVRPDLVEPCA